MSPFTRFARHKFSAARHLKLFCTPAAQAARQFGVTQGLLMQWRRKAGVPKFTDGLKIISDKCNAVPVKIPEESLGAKQESRDDWTKGKGTKPSRRGLKKPFYSAELRKRVLDHYR